MKVHNLIIILRSCFKYYLRYFISLSQGSSETASEARPPPPPLLKIPAPVREEAASPTGAPQATPSLEDSPQDPGGTPQPAVDDSPGHDQPPQEEDQGRKYISQLLDN